MTHAWSLADPQPRTTDWGSGDKWCCLSPSLPWLLHPAARPHSQVTVLGRYLYAVPCPPPAESTRHGRVPGQAQLLPLLAHPIATLEVKHWVVVIKWKL